MARLLKPALGTPTFGCLVNVTELLCGGVLDIQIHQAVSCGNTAKGKVDAAANDVTAAGDVDSKGTK